MFTYFNNQCHGESVYNLIKTTEAPPPNPPMYRSMYSEKVREEAQSNKVGCRQTMGVPKECLCPPDNYLRKNSRAPITVYPSGIPKVQLMVDAEEPSACENSGSQDQLNENEDGSGDCQAGQNDAACQDDMTPCCQQKRRVRYCCTLPKPPVPKACCCKLGVIPRGDRDFIEANALKVVRTPARIPEPRYVYHRQGHTHNWETSGYPRKFVCKKGFGEVPDYINCVKQRLYEEDMKRKWEVERPKREAREKCRHLPNDEREQIICGLKNRWEVVFKEYQSMPLLIDTAAKIRQRFDLEKSLKDIENKIQLMERHDHIFVADTDKSFYLN